MVGALVAVLTLATTIGLGMTQAPVTPPMVGVGSVPGQFTFLNVPPGFSPLRASASQLAYYGFPPRPSGGHSLALWLQAMSDAKHEATSRPAKSGVYLGPDTSIGQKQGNWAGYYANSSANGGEQWQEIQSQWIVPSVPANSHYSDYWTGDPMDAFWTGLGGGGSDQYIAQAGVLTVSESTPSYYFFTETTDTQSTPILEGPTIIPGNTAYVEVWYNGNYAEYFLENETSGSYQSFATYDYNVDRNSIECVAEWPYIYSAYLPNFGSMNFTACNAEVTGSGYFQNMSAFNYYQMGDWYSGTRLQYPDALSGGSFKVVWQNPS